MKVKNREGTGDMEMRKRGRGSGGGMPMIYKPHDVPIRTRKA